MLTMVVPREFCPFQDRDRESGREGLLGVELLFHIFFLCFGLLLSLLTKDVEIVSFRFIRVVLCLCGTFAGVWCESINALLILSARKKKLL